MTKTWLSRSLPSPPPLKEELAVRKTLIAQLMGEGLDIMPIEFSHFPVA